MPIHILDNDNLVEYQKNPIDKENEIENFIENHPEILDKDIFIIGRQVLTTAKTRIDLMGLDKDGNVVIIEIKKGISAREVISQILEYGVWAEELQFEDLNRIAKEKHLSSHKDLYKKYEIEFKTIPEPFNQNQRLYIVAEKIDDKIEQICRYLRVRGIDIVCIELNFYEKNGTKLVETRVVVGTEETISQELGDETPDAKLTWKDKLEMTKSENRDTVLGLISKIEQRFICVGEPHKRWYFIYTKNVRERKNLFAVVMCGKETASIAFRIDPESFNIVNDKIRKIRGWFFSKATERRISISKENYSLIIECLEHSYNHTKILNE